MNKKDIRKQKGVALGLLNVHDIDYLEVDVQLLGNF